MAFDATTYNQELIEGKTPRRRHTYTTTDAKATVLGAGYFADLGSTSGNGSLTAGDKFDVQTSDSPGGRLLLVVTDAAAGTVDDLVTLS